MTLPDGTIPPLVDRATFDAAQERARRNAQEAARHNSNPEAYLLRGGYVVCGKCGKTVSASFRTNRDGSRTPDYRVTVSAAQHPDCRGVAIPAATLDAAAETYLRRVVLDRGVLGLMIDRLRDKDTTAVDLAATEAALAPVKKRQAVVAGAVACLDDPDAAAPLLEKLETLARERRGLEGDRERLQGRHDAASATLARLDDLQERAAMLAENWHLLPYAAKRDLLAAIDLRVTLYPKDAPDRYTIESDADALLDAIASHARH
jgi:site-specific DNA recombinase